MTITKEVVLAYLETTEKELEDYYFLVNVCEGNVSFSSNISFAFSIEHLSEDEQKQVIKELEIIKKDGFIKTTIKKHWIAIQAFGSSSASFNYTEFVLEEVKKDLNYIKRGLMDWKSSCEPLIDFLKKWDSLNLIPFKWMSDFYDILQKELRLNTPIAMLEQLLEHYSGDDEWQIKEAINLIENYWVLKRLEEESQSED